MSTLVSKRLAAGDLESSGYDSRSPPTVIRTLLDSVFKGRWSRTNVAYVTSRPWGTSFLWIKSIVSVWRTPLLFPCANRPYSLLKLFFHRFCVGPASILSIVSFVPFGRYIWFAVKWNKCWAMRCWAAKWRKFVPFEEVVGRMFVDRLPFDRNG